MKTPGRKPKIWRGYRNCATCTRWRPVSDFPVRRTRTGYEQITEVCDYCVRQRERERYQRKSAEEKQKIGERANKRAKKRQNKALIEIERLHSILDKQNEKMDRQQDKLACYT